MIGFHFGYHPLPSPRLTWAGAAYGDRSNTSSLADHFSGVSGERSSTDSGTADGVATPTGRSARAGSRAHPGHKTYGHGTLKPLRVSGLIQASSRGGGRSGAKKKGAAASPQPGASSDDDRFVFFFPLVCE